MFHTDGTLLARYPYVDRMIGQKFRSAPLLERVLSKGGQQTLRVKARSTTRTGSDPRPGLSCFPIIVVATNAVSAALADWREQTRLMVTAAALSASVIALILFLIIRQISRQNREAQQRLELERGPARTALEQHDPGAVLYDAPGRVVTVNRRYIDMFLFVDRHREAGQPPSRSDAASQGHSAPLTTTWTNFVPLSCKTSHEGRSIAPPCIARTAVSFLAVSKPLARGGWVATMEDITERRKLERERDRNYTFLQSNYRSHPLADHRERCAGPPLPAGEPRGRDPVRLFARRASSERRPSTCFQKPPPN